MDFVLMHPDAKVPTRGSDGAAGFDLYCVDEFEIPAGEIRLISLGISSSFPNGVVGIIKDRSSLASRGIVTAGGIIDSDYRGEWKVILRNTRQDASFRGVMGDRVAQVIFTNYITGVVREVRQHNETFRGMGGFGSTGK